MCHGQLLSQAFVKARKRHQCGACLQYVESGMKYVRTTAVIEGDFQTSKLCARCQALLQAYYSELEYDADYCFSLRELRAIVKEELHATGGWAKFKRAWRRALELGPEGSWHT